MVFAVKIIVMDWAKDGIFINTDFPPQTKTPIENIYVVYVDKIQKQ